MVNPRHISSAKDIQDLCPTAREGDMRKTDRTASGVFRRFADYRYWGGERGQNPGLRAERKSPYTFIPNLESKPGIPKRPMGARRQNGL